MVRRGIRVGIQELLSLTDRQLRNELQAAIGGAIFRRPNVPGFPADPHSVNNPVGAPAGVDQQSDVYPPDWLNHLQDIFDQHAFIEQTEEGPVIYVQSWFVNHMLHPVCDFPRSIKIDAFSAWVVP